MATLNNSATYRGYRRQALYVLWRLVTDAASLSQIYQPEGDEDLAVFSAEGKLVEATQVKDYSSPLTLSDFKPGSADGFFARMHRRVAAHPQCKIAIASFGPIGTELAAALKAPGSQRTSVASKLNAQNRSIPLPECETLLARLSDQIIHPDERTLTADIRRTLAPTIAGVHGDTALELLLFAIFDASEQQRPITRQTLLQRVEQVGAYLAALRNHSTEWSVSIGPLQSRAVNADERTALRASYRIGAQATWDHILADVDTVRPARLDEIHNLFRTNQAVVIRGASGQGKSTLALRYMRDFAADGLRFYVRFLDGREHAVRIANALRNHIAALALRAIVIVDLAPSDSGWVELVKDLAVAGIKVLVTVREEDFHRAGVASRDVLFGEVGLDSISRAEARDIYDSLTQSGTDPVHVDFDEAWSRFTAGDNGPLLEFTHIVSEGRTLASTIDAQITRLQHEASHARTVITPRHLKLLALAAIANEAECRVPLLALCQAADLDPLTRPLSVLEDEYLLKTVTERADTLVVPLHSVRSRAIVSALFHDGAEGWLDLAIECLPLVVDADLERFLLFAFLRRPQASHGLEVALRSVPLRTWTQAASISRALLWLGISRYETENQNSLDAAIKEHGDSVLVTSDIYVASDASANELLRQTIADVIKVDRAKLPTVTLTEKPRAFDPFSSWASTALPPAYPLAAASDWSGLGDVAFWLGSRGINCPLANAVLAVLPDTIPDGLRIGEVAQFVSGRFAMGDRAFTRWLDQHYSTLSSRFVAETGSIAVLANDDGSLTVLFQVSLTKSPASEDGKAYDLHSQAMGRIHLLHQLFPQFHTLKSQGIGVDVLAFLLPNDETRKAIPVSNLASPRKAQANRMLRNLIAYRLQRARSWSDYADAVFRLRRNACDAFRGLHRGWAKFLEHHKIVASDFQKMPGLELTRLQATRIHMFPQTAVDEWGFVSEDNDQDTDQRDSRAIRLLGSIRRFDDWRRTWREYETAVGHVARRAVDLSLIHLGNKNFGLSAPAESQEARLAIVNLAAAWKSLRELQLGFRRWFGRYVSEQKLDELERHEVSTFGHLWPVAFALVHEPNAGVDGVSRLKVTVSQRRLEFLRGISSEVGQALGTTERVTVRAEPYRLDRKSCLTVVCDHDALAAVDVKRADVLQALWRASRLRAWRPFEATPLEIEWTDILVVHTVRGKAVASAGASVSLQALFGAEERFDVKPHHTLPVPVGLDELGVAMWESPAVKKILEFQASVVSFLLAAGRFESIVQAAGEYALNDEAIAIALESWSTESSRLRREAAQLCDEVALIVSRDRHEEGTAGGPIDHVLAELTGISSRWLMTNSSDVVWTPTAFMAWANEIGSRPDAINVLTTELIDLVIANQA